MTCNSYSFTRIMTTQCMLCSGVIMHVFSKMIQWHEWMKSFQRMCKNKNDNMNHKHLNIFIILAVICQSTQSISPHGVNRNLCCVGSDYCMMIIMITMYRVNTFPSWQLGNNNIDPPHPRLATSIQRERGNVISKQ